MEASPRSFHKDCVRRLPNIARPINPEILPRCLSEIHFCSNNKTYNYFDNESESNQDNTSTPDFVRCLPNPLNLLKFCRQPFEIISATITRREKWKWQYLTLPILTNFERILIIIRCSTWLSRSLRNGLPCQSLRGLRQRSYGEYFYKILSHCHCHKFVSAEVQVWKWALRARNFLQQQYDEN